MFVILRKWINSCRCRWWSWCLNNLRNNNRFWIESVKLNAISYNLNVYELNGRKCVCVCVCALVRMVNQSIIIACYRMGGVGHNIGKSSSFTMRSENNCYDSSTECRSDWTGCCVNGLLTTSEVVVGDKRSYIKKTMHMFGVTWRRYAARPL